MDAEPTRRFSPRRVIMVGAAAVVVMITAVCLLSPWPATLVIRAVFDNGAQQLRDQMRRNQPELPIESRHDVPYGDGRDMIMDVFRPGGQTEPLPAIVWIHGGAWVSGSKADVAPYLELLAHDGYVGIGLNYTRGPEATYPTAVEQLNAALAHISANATEYGVDPDRIVLAGDSAGAQLASQLATLITNPDYARLAELAPGIGAYQLAGVVLHCGVYDLAALSLTDGIVGWGFRTAMWAYTGHRDWDERAAVDMMSTKNWVTPDFPPTFISGGNGDGLTRPQSMAMAQALSHHGVEVTELFFPDDHEPSLPHEYQFHLDLADAQLAYERTLGFLGSVTA
ncbi:alpha/beta hydrolase [Propionibacteriaceae bacterium Y2011]|uniref:alpha/beta hydrolase n=1 Tax=Microlunatus sp. Y2014 TaxID=3418488 RepID=UPI003B4DE392